MGPSRFSSRRLLAPAIVVAAAIAALFALWRVTARAPSIPDHPLRIGFESNPPVQVRTDGGFSGLAVEIVNEAAKRARVKLEWVETGTSSDEAFQQGLVDLWPLMVDLPERRKYVHFPRPWMHSDEVLLLRQGTPSPDRGFRGRIATFRMPLHVRQVRQLFPEATLQVVPAIHDVIKQVCTGATEAAFFEARVAQGELRDRPSDCASVALRAQMIPEARFQAGLASTSQAAGTADILEREIDKMFRDGTLSVLIAKYSYFGLDDAWSSYEQAETEQRRRWFTLAGCGLILAFGVVLWLASSLRMRKRAEAALRESEARFRTLANTAPMMIVASGPDARATFFNNTWLNFTGRAFEQELGDGWVANLHPEDRGRVLAEYASSFGSRGDCKIEYRLRRADGEYRHVICSGVPRFDPDGAFVGYIASCVDLTDIKIAEEEARQRQNLESLGVLAGGIAHDFNNLLGGTLAYAELAQTKLADGESPNDELRQISAVAVRGSEIVRQLMIYAGNERGALEPVDVSSLVRDMLELLKVSISKRAVLRTSLGNQLPLVCGNAAQIRQVLMNLVTNASEAIGDRDGVIRVNTQRVTVGRGPNPPEFKNLTEGHYLGLDVSDTGCGMTPETQRKVFDPFFTTKFAGRGMGLAVVQQIVRRLGGAIQMVSAAGQGTTVRIVLPAADGAGLGAANGDAAGSAALKSQQQITSAVLVVEDELALLAALSKMLQRKGFSVIQASDGTTALNLIRAQEKRIDAMLLDVTLPGASSREVLEEAERLRPDMTAILTSAYSKESVRATLARLKVEHFIRKPFLIDDLVRLLEDALSIRSAEAQNVMDGARAGGPA
jgi:PAS domain S-box-containing protein